MVWQLATMAERLSYSFQMASMRKEVTGAWCRGDEVGSAMLLHVHCLDRTMLGLGVERKLVMALAGKDSLYLGVLEVTHDHGTALQPGKR
jgi:hypothetical protein